MPRTGRPRGQSDGGNYRQPERKEPEKAGGQSIRALLMSPLFGLFGFLEARCAVNE